jgi:hypothetical protein
MVRHPSLVSVYDAGLDESTGLYFLVMDYMPGGSVATHLSREHRFSIRKAATFVRNISVGLIELKRLGIVHRDVKPLNMLVAADGSARLSDFGIALFAGSRSLSDPASKDVVVGTPLYMPVEQVENSDSVDCRADIYALGVSFYEMLVGVCPDSTLTSDELLRKRLNGDRLPDITTVNTAIPADVAQLISRMTDPVADNRPSAEDVVAELDAMLDSEKDRQPVLRSASDLSRWVIAASVVGFAAFLIYFLVKLPSWLADRLTVERDEFVQAEMPAVALADDSFVRPDAAVGGVVTQLVETVKEVVRTVVVTAAQDVAVASVHDDESGDGGNGLDDGEAEPILPQSSDDLGVSPDSGEVAEADRPQDVALAITNKVCGIRIIYKPGMESKADAVMSKIAAADKAVRYFRPYGNTEMVQSAVRRITLDEECPDTGGYSFERSKASLSIGLELISSEDDFNDLVSRFMTSGRDKVEEPFERYLYEYIRLSVCDRISKSAKARDRIDGAIRYAQNMDRAYRPSDYNGQVKAYGARHQVVPKEKAARYGEGKVFWLMRELESIDKKAIRHYFEAKAKAVQSRLIVADKMTVHDCAVLFSNAIDDDVYSLLKKEGWGVDKFATKVKLGKGLDSQLLERNGY